ncbi:hypothetical protein EJ05DRAFT_108710 [Pseudovirgaria hyperparasitica]|uniref:Uncharacterized protein n=1 Tax=Pseudovirgaria hyperparasitica TaxID=470096 RepID=A0A6A6VY80_9PEZI|nr:uncharacterized protein EJ05DRAFT_108710 [Pseudovirgaria hyperparasitica]KAF2755618.1 hypothetical protein EJ05DRAFT_108710 [Pseudovirgaria hyperparasitica]
MSDPDPVVDDVVEATSAFRLDTPAQSDRDDASPTTGQSNNSIRDDPTQAHAAPGVQSPQSVAHTQPIEVNGKTRVWDITSKFSEASSGKPNMFTP